MTSINCDLCGEEICKYAMDFRACGGVSAQVGEDLKLVRVHRECAKEVMENLLESVGL